MEVRTEVDNHLPLTHPAACVQVADVLDLSKFHFISLLQN